MLVILVNVSDASAAGEAIMREGYYEDFKRAWIESLALAGDVCKFFLWLFNGIFMLKIMFIFSKFANFSTLHCWTR